MIRGSLSLLIPIVHTAAGVRNTASQHDDEFPLYHCCTLHTSPQRPLGLPLYHVYIPVCQTTPQYAICGASMTQRGRWHSDQHWRRTCPLVLPLLHGLRGTYPPTPTEDNPGVEGRPGCFTRQTLSNPIVKVWFVKHTMVDGLLYPGLAAKYRHQV